MALDPAAPGNTPNPPVSPTPLTQSVDVATVQQLFDSFSQSIDNQTEKISAGISSSGTEIGKAIEDAIKQIKNFLNEGTPSGLKKRATDSYTFSKKLNECVSQSGNSLRVELTHQSAQGLATKICESFNRLVIPKLMSMKISVPATPTSLIVPTTSPTGPTTSVAPTTTPTAPTTTTGPIDPIEQAAQILLKNAEEIKEHREKTLKRLRGEVVDLIDQFSNLGLDVEKVLFNLKTVDRLEPFTKILTQLKKIEELTYLPKELNTTLQKIALAYESMDASQMKDAHIALKDIGEEAKHYDDLLHKIEKSEITAYKASRITEINEQLKIVSKSDALAKFKEYNKEINSMLKVVDKSKNLIEKLRDLEEVLGDNAKRAEYFENELKKCTDEKSVIILNEELEKTYKILDKTHHKAEGLKSLFSSLASSMGIITAGAMWGVAAEVQQITTRTAGAMYGMADASGKVVNHLREQSRQLSIESDYMIDVKQAAEAQRKLYQLGIRDLERQNLIGRAIAKNYLAMGVEFEELIQHAGEMNFNLRLTGQQTASIVQGTANIVKYFGLAANKVMQIQSELKDVFETIRDVSSVSAEAVVNITGMMVALEKNRGSVGYAKELVKTFSGGMEEWQQGTQKIGTLGLIIQSRLLSMNHSVQDFWSGNVSAIEIQKTTLEELTNLYKRAIQWGSSAPALISSMTGGQIKGLNQLRNQIEGHQEALRMFGKEAVEQLDELQKKMKSISDPNEIKDLQGKMEQIRTNLISDFTSSLGEFNKTYEEFINPSNLIKELDPESYKTAMENLSKQLQEQAPKIKDKLDFALKSGVEIEGIDKLKESLNKIQSGQNPNKSDMELIQKTLKTTQKKMDKQAEEERTLTMKNVKDQILAGKNRVQTDILIAQLQCLDKITKFVRTIASIMTIFFFGKGIWSLASMISPAATGAISAGAMSSLKALFGIGGGAAAGGTAVGIGAKIARWISTTRTAIIGWIGKLFSTPLKAIETAFTNIGQAMKAFVLGIIKFTDKILYAIGFKGFQMVSIMRVETIGPLTKLLSTAIGKLVTRIAGWVGIILLALDLARIQSWVMGKIIALVSKIDFGKIGETIGKFTVKFIGWLLKETIIGVLKGLWAVIKFWSYQFPKLLIMLQVGLQKAIWGFIKGAIVGIFEMLYIALKAVFIEFPYWIIQQLTNFFQWIYDSIFKSVNWFIGVQEKILAFLDRVDKEGVEIIFNWIARKLKAFFASIWRYLEKMFKFEGDFTNALIKLGAISLKLYDFICTSLGKMLILSIKILFVSIKLALKFYFFKIPELLGKGLLNAFNFMLYDLPFKLAKIVWDFFVNNIINPMFGIKTLAKNEGKKLLDTVKDFFATLVNAVTTAARIILSPKEFIFKSLTSLLKNKDEKKKEENKDMERTIGSSILKFGVNAFSTVLRPLMGPISRLGFTVGDSVAKALLKNEKTQKDINKPVIELQKQTTTEDVVKLTQKEIDKQKKLEDLKRRQQERYLERQQNPALDASERLKLANERAQRTAIVPTNKVEIGNSQMDMGETKADIPNAGDLGNTEQVGLLGNIGSNTETTNEFLKKILVALTSPLTTSRELSGTFAHRTSPSPNNIRTNSQGSYHVADAAWTYDNNSPDGVNQTSPNAGNGGFA